MTLLRRLRGSMAVKLMCLFALLLIAFALITGVIYNTLLRRQTIQLYSQTMQRDAYAIAQNLSELLAPTSYNASLDETRLIVSEETLAPYLAFIEQLTNSSVYLIDTRHNVTGYFSGVVQTLPNPQLPGYMEQTIALGFMGKTPFIRSERGGETHLTACMPVMNAQSRVLGVVLLESTLREQGFTQVSGSSILLNSTIDALLLSFLLAFIFSRRFTRPIIALKQVALALSGGQYETRTKIRKSDEIGSLAHSMDILAEQLEQARRHAEQLRSQQQIFFSNISHELKTPVTVIRGSLEALSDGVITGEAQVQAYYRQMIAESRWLQRLIQDLLELSRLQNTEFSLNLSTVDLCELLGDVAMSAHALCERRGVLFSCTEPEVHFTLHGDYSRLRQMLLAVADNAVKFTPPGKRVSMSLSAERPVIIIEDEGAGIPQAEIAHIFDRFRHTHDSSRESTGLGLAIVQEIARRHGIAIHVQSREGEGTRFTFAFPDAGKLPAAPPPR